MSEFVKVLIERDGMSLDDARDTERDIKRMLVEGELEYTDLEDLLHDEYGLEPDYVFEFL
jgi:hypothetical protein